MRIAELLRGIVSLRLLRKKEGGRLPASEVLVGTGYVRKLISENKISDIPKAIEQGGHYGMQSYLQSLLDIYNKGLADLDECKSAATSPDDFMTRVRGVKAGT